MRHVLALLVVLFLGFALVGCGPAETCANGSCKDVGGQLFNDLPNQG